MAYLLIRHCRPRLPSRPDMILDSFDRIDRAIGTDPAQAIGSAKELIEATEKTVLDELGVTFDDKTVKLPWLIDRPAPTRTAPADGGAGAGWEQRHQAHPRWPDQHRCRPGGTPQRGLGNGARRTATGSALKTRSHGGWGGPHLVPGHPRHPRRPDRPMADRLRRPPRNGLRILTRGDRPGA